ncbi:MAG: DUF6152 family protein [Gammaproteobacteria bacterium]
MNWIKTTALAACLSPSLVVGHHSTFEYDLSVVHELTGEIVQLQWRNPHVRMSVRVRDDDGTEQVWDMEAQDINSLDRAGVPRDLVEAGQLVRVAGSPSTRREASLLLTNLLLPDGREVLMHLSKGPRWNNEVIGDRQAVRGREEEFEAPVADIFRAWTTVQSNMPDYSEDPPLTAAARAAYESFDPASDDPVLLCIAPGMPEAMTYIGPHPVEFVLLENGDIEILIESDDNVRVVHMSDDASAETQPPSALGFSVGRWEDDDLVVTTTRINWPYFKVFGLVAAPQSEDMEIVERFALEPERGELIYGFTASDPATFTEPVTADRYHVWRYRPGVAVEPYECTLDE